MCRLGSTSASLKLKGIDGDPHKWWSMWFNSMVSEAPHQGLKQSCMSQKWEGLRGCSAGAAWLSSARVVRCSVKSGNERNPCRVLQVSRETAPYRVQKFFWFRYGEEGGDDVKSAWPFDTLGDTRATMTGIKGCQTARWS